MAYKAQVVRITVRPHPNADRLQLATCNGYQVVVGLEQKTGDIGVFFRADGQLSPEFAAANDLVRRKNPETGAHEGGFFEEKRRVRSQPFRGEKSDGFWCEPGYFKFAGPVQVDTAVGRFSVGTKILVVGDEFDSINGIAICSKYETPATIAARKRGHRAHRRETRQFRMHVDTHHLRDRVGRIPLGSIITITEKVHGTSHRYGHVSDKVNLPWWKLRRLLRLPYTKMEWRYLSGSRRVILRSGTVDNWFGSNEFRDNAIAMLRGNLRKGEAVYAEIVGYTETGRLIAESQSIRKIKDSKLRKSLLKYGDNMEYTYGCGPAASGAGGGGGGRGDIRLAAAFGQSAVLRGADEPVFPVIAGCPFTREPCITSRQFPK